MRSFAVFALLAAYSLHAQTSTPSAAAITKNPVPVVTLSFGSPQQTPLGQKGAAMLDNTTCSPDGSLFLVIAGSPEKMDFALNSLTNGTEDVRFAASPGSEYEYVGWPAHYFAGDDSVVTLISAEIRKNPMEESQSANPQEVTLALVYNRKGTLEHVVPIPQDFDATSIGMYGSGDLLVVAKDPVRNGLRLLVLDKDGDKKNELSLFDYDYDTGQKTRKKQPLAKVFDAADFIQIVQDGDNLLLVPTGTAATVIEVNEQGIVRATDLQLPPGYLLRSLLSMDGGYWTVSTYMDAKILSNPQPGTTGVVFRNGPLFQFNSFDGGLVRRIDSPANLNNGVRCAHNGEFTALTTDKKTGRLEVLTGSIPR